VETELCWVAGEQDDARGQHREKMDSLYGELQFNGGCDPAPIPVHRMWRTFPLR